MFYFLNMFIYLVLIISVQNTEAKKVSKRSKNKIQSYEGCVSYEAGVDSNICNELQRHHNQKSTYQILHAEGLIKLKTKIYPEEKHFNHSLVGYDEPLHPIPIGPTVYFCCFLALLVLRYLTAFCHYALDDVKNEMNLYPQTAKFPILPLYWLQQSKRELTLRREFRNTWAWIAKRYLLSPGDPLLHDIEEVMGRTTWGEFEVPRNTWSQINVIMKLNQLYVDVHETEDGPTFSLQKDNEQKFTRLNMNSLLRNLRANLGDAAAGDDEMDAPKKVSFEEDNARETLKEHHEEIHKEGDILNEEKEHIVGGADKSRVSLESIHVAKDKNHGSIKSIESIKSVIQSIKDEQLKIIKIKSKVKKRKVKKHTKTKDGSSRKLQDHHIQNTSVSHSKHIHHLNQKKLILEKKKHRIKSWEIQKTEEYIQEFRKRSKEEGQQSQNNTQRLQSQIKAKRVHSKGHENETVHRKGQEKETSHSHHKDHEKKASHHKDHGKEASHHKDHEKKASHHRKGHKKEASHRNVHEKEASHRKGQEKEDNRRKGQEKEANRRKGQEKETTHRKDNEKVTETTHRKDNEKVTETTHRKDHRKDFNRPIQVFKIRNPSHTPSHHSHHKLKQHHSKPKADPDHSPDLLVLHQNLPNDTDKLSLDPDPDDDLESLIHHDSEDIPETLSHQDPPKDIPELLVHHDPTGLVRFELVRPSGRVLPEGEEEYKVVLNETSEGQIVVELREPEPQNLKSKNKKNHKKSKKPKED